MKNKAIASANVKMKNMKGCVVAMFDGNAGSFSYGFADGVLPAEGDHAHFSLPGGDGHVLFVARSVSGLRRAVAAFEEEWTMDGFDEWLTDDADARAFAAACP